MGAKGNGLQREWGAAWQFGWIPANGVRVTFKHKSVLHAKRCTTCRIITIRKENRETHNNFQSIVL